VSYRKAKAWGLGATLLMLASGVLQAVPARAQDAFDLEAFRGKIVWVDFWASWCTPCRRSFPWLNEVMARYGDQGLEIVGVNVDKERALAEEFLRDTPARFSIAYYPEGAMAAKYEVLGMPSSFLIDRDGNVISSHIGFRRDERENYEAAIVEALSE